MASASARVTDAQPPSDRSSAPDHRADWHAQAVDAAYRGHADPTHRHGSDTAAPYINPGFEVTSHDSGGHHPAKQTLTVDGGNRQGTASLLLPDNYDPHKKYPLIVALHGFQGNVNDISNMMNVERLRKEGNIVLVPAAQDHSWNGSGIDYLGAANGANGKPINDLDFVKSAIQQVEGKYSVNRNDITLSTFSQGGQLGYELAADMDRNPGKLGKVRNLISAAGSDPDGRDGHRIDPLPGTNIVQYEPGHNWIQAIGNVATGDPSVAEFMPKVVAAKHAVPIPSLDTTRDGVQITAYRGSDGSTVTEINEPRGEHAWPGQPVSNDSALLGRGSISHIHLTDWVSDYSAAFRNY